MLSLRMTAALILIAFLSALSAYVSSQPPPPPQGITVVDSVALHFMAGITNDELPADGITSCSTMVIINWHVEGGTPPPNPKLNVSYTVAQGGGHFEPSSKEVPLNGNPVVVTGVSYQQDSTPSPTSSTVIGWAQVNDKTGEDSIAVRGVSLEVIKYMPAEALYSGTATMRACCPVIVRAYCPENAQLKPRDNIRASVVGQGVYLKKTDGTWTKSDVDQLEYDTYGGMPPQGPAQIAQFTIATDNPGDLPLDPLTANFNAKLNDADSPVAEADEAEVYAPQTMVCPEPGADEVAVKSGQALDTHLKWYADIVEGEGTEGAKYYWGAKGQVTWSLPQGDLQDNYVLDTGPPGGPFHATSAATTTAGTGTRSITEERGHVVNSPISVTPTPKQWAEENQANIKAPYDFAKWLVDSALFLLKKLF